MAGKTINITVNGNTTISGSVAPVPKAGRFESACSEILAKWDRGHKTHAREELSGLLDSAAEDPKVLETAAIIYFHDRRYTEALEFICKALKRSPENISWLNLCAQILRHMDRYDEAIDHYKKAVDLDAENEQAYNGLGIIYRYQGQTAKAIEMYEMAIRKKPDFYSAIYNLSNIPAYTFSPEILTSILNLLPQTKIANDLSRIYFALYNYYSNTSQFEKAFYYLNEGNAAEFMKNKYHDTMSVFVEKTQSAFNEAFIQNAPKLKNADMQPVFIIGMPRSGSSLLEQILVTHNAIHGFGESTRMINTLKNVNGRIYKNPDDYFIGFQNQDVNSLQSIQEDYLREIKADSGNLTIYTDKTLDNFKYVGFIKLLIPNARFIHIKRHPMDNCFACFENRFTYGHEYSFNLEKLGDYYVNYRKIMDHWQTLFSENIYEIQYENLVVNMEKEIGQVFDFLELEMDEKCLNYFENDRMVVTASTDQVKRKPYTSSIGRWKNYEKQLSPLVSIFTRERIVI